MTTWLEKRTKEALVKNQKGLRERSGSYITGDRLVSFLYQLMRDHVPPGGCGKVRERQPDGAGAPHERLAGEILRGHGEEAMRG